MINIKWIPVFISCIFINEAIAKEGFNHKNSATIPQIVQSRIPSIFRLEMPAYLTLETVQAEEFLKAENMNDEGIQAIQQCLKTNLKSCTFPITNMQATGFLNSEGTGLWTNCHLIDGWIRYLKQQMIWGRDSQKLINSIKKKPVPIKVFSESGVQLNNQKDSFLVSLVNVIDGVDAEASGCNFRDDAVLFNVSRKLGPGIPWQKTDMNQVMPNEVRRSFIGGYPLPAGRLKNIIKNLSQKQPVQTYFWTTGKIETQPQFLDRLLSLNKNPDNYLFASSGAYTLLMTNDSSEGMSGSPILNSSGEVMGIFKGVLPRNSEKNSENDFPLVSIGISIDGLSYLKFLNND